MNDEEFRQELLKLKIPVEWIENVSPVLNEMRPEVSEYSKDLIIAAAIFSDRMRGLEDTNQEVFISVQVVLNALMDLLTFEEKVLLVGTLRHRIRIDHPEEIEKMTEITGYLYTIGVTPDKEIGRAYG